MITLPVSVIALETQASSLPFASSAWPAPWPVMSEPLCCFNEKHSSHAQLCPSSLRIFESYRQGMYTIEGGQKRDGWARKKRSAEIDIAVSPRHTASQRLPISPNPHGNTVFHRNRNDFHPREYIVYFLYYLALSCRYEVERVSKTLGQELGRLVAGQPLCPADRGDHGED